MLSLFQFAVYSLAALVGTASLAILRHRFRQRSLRKIPGPSNPSIFWGKLRGLEENGSHVKIMSRPWATYVQPLCPLLPRGTPQDIRKSSTRLWFFGCTSYWRRLLTAASPHTQICYEQDIQLVVSDPRALNNIFVKDQPIFELTEAFLQCVFPFE